MKNLIAVLLCFVALSGCKKEDNKTGTYSIIGSWNLSRITTKIFSADEVVFQADTILSNSNVFTFKSDGKGSLNNKADFIGLYNFIYNETLSGGFNYSISNSEIGITFLKDDEMPIKKSIVFLDGNQLILHTEENVDINGRCNPTGGYKYVIDEYLFK